MNRDIFEFIWYKITKFLGDKTYRIRHIWTYGHIPFRLSLGYGHGFHRCIRCFRYQQRKDKGESV